MNNRPQSKVRVAANVRTKTFYLESHPEQQEITLTHIIFFGNPMGTEKNITSFNRHITTVPATH